MEARLTRSIMSVATVLFVFSSIADAQFSNRREHAVRSQNFIIFADSPQWAEQVAQSAEQQRRDLAIYWLGQELPPWAEPCPVHVHSAANLLASGETRFSLLPRGAGNWMMSVQGTPERILDSVLPHEITHTILASYFAPLGKYVPRWADEGACTTVEHVSEKVKHTQHLQKFLRTGFGLPFNRMFTLKEYPKPILPLYAQGHSVVQFLIDQGGPRKFISFVEMGMQTDNWTHSLREHYEYQTIGELQTLWNQWIVDGSPDNIAAYAPSLRNEAAPTMLASNSQSDTSLEGKVKLAIGNTDPAPVRLASDPRPVADTTQLASDPISLMSSNVSPGSTEVLGNESWYKRRLREIQSPNHNDVRTPTTPTKRDASMDPVASVQQPATVSIGARPANQFVGENTRSGGTAHLDAMPAGDTGARSAAVYQSVGRPQPAQAPKVQVLDWGASEPVPGMQSQPLQMVPIRR